MAAAQVARSPAAIRRFTCAMARSGFVANASFSGIPAFFLRCGSAAQQSGMYTSKSAHACPSAVTSLTAGIRYDPGDPGRSDIDLWHREITLHCKGRKTRTVKISFDAARSLDRYLRVRARHPQAHRPQLWLGGRQPGADDNQRDLPGHRPARTPVRHRRVPAPVRHHFSHTWLDRVMADAP
jgi:hypothetical protein